MVDLRRDPDAAGPVVTGFSGPAFRVRDRVFRHGLMLTPKEAMEWDAPTVDALATEHLTPLLSLDPGPEFILLGTGGALKHPPRSFVRALEEQGIGVEVMDSRAAARAWGVLRTEGRWIAAAFLPL